MKRIFVDTGAWYALIDRKDPDHASVQACLDSRDGRLVTSNFVVDEAIALLRYRVGWRAARIFGDTLFHGAAASLLRISPKDESRAWEIFTGYRDKRFSFTDCTSFALMERLDISSAVALDIDFRSYGVQCLP